MALPADIVAGLARCLAERAGLDLPAWVIASRARARMAACGLEPGAYLEHVRAGRGAAELAALIEAVRVGETRFFRHRAQLDALETVVVPALAARGKPVRAWSAGCASGEEAYTLALVLGARLPDLPVSVIGTDVSEDALAVAARAVYPRAALTQVPEAYQAGFEDASGGEVRVRAEVARRVSFEPGNLLEAEPPRGCALVWCRNVLIYFGPEARRRAVERLVGALEPGGHLFVGYSESLRDVGALDPVRAGEATVYVKRASGTRTAETRTPVRGVPAQPPVPRPVHPVHPERRPDGPASRGPLVLTVDKATDPARLTAQLATALATPGLRALTVDLDGADFLADEVATILRRARAAAAAAHVALALRATRPGPARWLRRHGLDEEAP